MTSNVYKNGILKYHITDITNNSELYHAYTDPIKGYIAAACMGYRANGIIVISEDSMQWWLQGVGTNEQCPPPQP